MPFLSFPGLTAEVRTCSTILNKSAGSAHPCLLSDLRSKTFGFSPLSMTLAVCFRYMVTVIILGYVPSNLTLLSIFVITGCCTLTD